MWTLNDVLSYLLCVEAILVLALLAPPPLDFLSRILANSLTIADPAAFVNRYGQFISGNFLILILWVSYSVYGTYTKLADLSGESYLKARHNLFLHGFSLYLLLVLIGVVSLWKRMMTKPAAAKQ